MKKTALTLLTVLLLTTQAGAGNLDSLLAQKIAREGVGENIRLKHTRARMVGSNEYLPVEKLEVLDTDSLEISGLELNHKSRRFEANLSGTDGDLKLQGQYEIMVSLPTLSSTVHRGDIIGEKDIVWIDMPERTLRSNVVRSGKEMIGREAVRTIRTGNPVSTRDITVPDIVDKGDLVPMIYRTEYMELKTSGKAMESGAEGDVIRIKNVKSGKIIQAMLRDNGEAVVNY